MGADYIPESDLFAALWMKCFARALVQNPTGYRTTPENAAEIESLVHDFRVLNAQCHEPANRTSPRVREKNSARLAAEKLVRPEAQRIRTDPRIDAGLKVGIGLNGKRRRRQRVGAPQSAPDLTLNLNKNGLFYIDVRDGETRKRGRPREASGLELYERIRPSTEFELDKTEGRTGAITLDIHDVPIGWRFVGVFTRTPIVIEPSSRNPGDEAIYVARWITRRGEPGPFGNRQSERIRFNPAPRAFMNLPLRHKLAS